MEILPGVGVALVKVGESREVAEGRLGPPVHPGRHRRAVYATDPMLIVSYRADDTVEVVEIADSGDGGDEAFLDGVQLTFRFLDDVVADLAALGHRAEPTDIGYVFAAGFAIYSVGSRSPDELDPGASDDDERGICEGVAVGPFGDFREPAAEGAERAGDSGPAPVGERQLRLF